jgi:hypothetical protein
VSWTTRSAPARVNARVSTTTSVDRATFERVRDEGGFLESFEV